MFDSDDIPSNKTSNKPFNKILETRLGRRRFLQKTALAGAVASVAACTKGGSEIASPEAEGFVELEQGLDEQLHVAAGHDAQVLLRWGDPLFEGAPEFDVLQQTVESQLQQFGYNNDFTGFVPLPLGSDSSDHGLLVVNHEYASPVLMFPGSPTYMSMTEEQVAIEQASQGLSVVEIERVEGEWKLRKDSTYNRRITPNTSMNMVGAAAGSERLITADSPDGVQTWGTYGNCAGGVTPWGTILTGEENIQDYFSGDFSGADPRQVENYTRFGIEESNGIASWARFFPRWDMASSPNEPLHAGWVVEIDPFDPESTPKKLTGMGRFKHEGANVTINSDGYAVAYSGDDQKFEYIYRFVSANKYQEGNRAANMQLLEEGTLSVARFSETALEWLPLVYGEGPLTEENGFQSQADVCLDTRKAADLVGATPMDRPEDVDVNPVTGSVFVMLTKNNERLDEQTDSANPRAINLGGHIVEMIPPAGDHTASVFSWNLFVMAGDPDQVATSYHPLTSDNGWFACPDNCAFDNRGNMWISTDGGDQFGIADGVWVAPVEGENRGRSKHFLRTPIGAELCGPYFTPDNTSFFCAVQHPGKLDEGSDFEQPVTRWPDFREDLPPRPSVVVITKSDGGIVGS